MNKDQEILIPLKFKDWAIDPDAEIQLQNRGKINKSNLMVSVSIGLLSLAYALASTTGDTMFTLIAAIFLFGGILLFMSIMGQGPLRRREVHCSHCTKRMKYHDYNIPAAAAPVEAIQHGPIYYLPEKITEDQEVLHRLMVGIFSCSHCQHYILATGIEQKPGLTQKELADATHKADETRHAIAEKRLSRKQRKHKKVKDN